MIENEVEVEDDHIEVGFTFLNVESIPICAILFKEIVNLDEWNFDTSLKKDWHDWEAIEADKSR